MHVSDLFCMHTAVIYLLADLTAAISFRKLSSSMSNQAIVQHTLLLLPLSSLLADLHVHVAQLPYHYFTHYVEDCVFNTTILHEASCSYCYM